ncbi:ribonuclease H-like domain-containing protein [Tanacetum coccineum]
MMNSEVVKDSETRTKESSKRAGDELESDKSKRQKIDKHVEAKKDNDLEEEEMKKHMEIVQDEEEIAIDAIHLATKPLIIVEYKIVKEGQKGFYHLIRADGSSKRYSSMSRMLQGIDIEDLKTLWQLVQEKHGINRSVDEYERVLWGDMKRQDHVVPPPYIGNFMPPKYDLVLADEGEYVFSESVTSIPDVTTSEAKTSVSKPKSVGEPLIKDWISDSEDENETEFKSKQRKPSFAKTEFVKSNEHVKTTRESVKKVENKKQAKYPRKNSQSPRGNQRNWNNLMTQKLGSNFEFKNKACYECGSFNHLIKDCDLYEKKMVEKTV